MQVSSRPQQGKQQGHQLILSAMFLQFATFLASE